MGGKLKGLVGLSCFLPKLGELAATGRSQTSSWRTVDGESVRPLCCFRSPPWRAGRKTLAPTGGDEKEVVSG
jgi:hypothetical protein